MSASGRPARSVADAAGVAYAYGPGIDPAWNGGGVMTAATGAPVASDTASHQRVPLGAGVAAGGMPGGTLALLRDLGGMAGIGLLSAAVLGGAFGWTGPMAYLLITKRRWPTARPRHGSGRPGHRTTAAAICAYLVIAAGLAVITMRGPRESGREPGPAS